ncbi:uncharacterized protein LOC133197411 [Saccostrea echinata]|uniref:uncharacterized protein LOC133197411 n=1 Tax=Saccostrea echinata TaxID=191078 RepID=UPI002A81B8DF|nr:uncharacterized protein LOC133197411 [Saccostrea echinata]
MADLNVEVPYKLLKNLMSLAAMEEHSMLKLAGLTLLQEFLKNDPKGEVKLSFLQNGILEPLLLTFDKGMDNPRDLVYLDVSLNCIFFLSELPVSPVQPLICEQVIKRMIQLIDQKGAFYHYLPSVKLNLQKVCENKHLVGRVHGTNMNADQWDRVYRTSKDQVTSILSLPEIVYVCDIVDSGGYEGGLNIREHLLSRNLAWADTKSVRPSKTDDEGDWKDILITHVVEGPVFWAQTGIETIQNAQKIQAILNVYWKNGALENYKCKKGDTVVVLQVINNEVSPIRVSVKEVNTRGVHAWALDFGQIITVDKKNVFVLPCEVRLDVFPPQASLCCIDGLQMPPCSESAVGTGLSILCNLVKRSFPSGHLLQQLGGLDVCLSFLKTCPNVDLKLQTCQLLCNLSCNPAISSKCSENQFIPVMIDCLQEYFEMKPSTQKNELLLACLRTLSNLMHFNDVNRSIFYQYQGMEAVLKVSLLKDRNHSVYKAATKCIKMFICKALERNTKDDAIKKKKKSSFGKGEKSKISRDTPLVMSKVLEEKDENDKFIWKPKAIEKVVDESRFQEVESSDDELTNHPVSLFSSQLKEQAQMSADRPAVAVDVADVYRSSQQKEVFVLDSVVPIQNNSTNELRPNKTIQTISVNTVVQHVCGMLNSGKGGNIYFGLSPTGKVIGMNFTRDDRDEFRIGVDRMMTDRLRPCLLHSCFDVVYTPVVQRLEAEDDGSQDLTNIPDLFVGKIVLTPSKGTFYTVTPEEDCYYRFGSRTTSLSIQELRHLIILEEEEEFRDKINNLKAELKSLQQQAGDEG